MKGYIILIISSFLISVSYCQIEVVHYNSEWNAENNYDISELKDCNKKDVVICHYPKQQEKHNIVSVPTVIIFDEGKEVKRFQANILMQLNCTLKDIQKQIDKILLTKFE